jgi:hypothetical protein
LGQWGGRHPGRCVSIQPHVHTACQGHFHGHNPPPSNAYLDRGVNFSLTLA